MYAFFIVRGLRRKGGLAVRAGALRLIPGVRASPSRTRTLMRSRSGSVSSLPTLSVTAGTWRRGPDLKDGHPTSGSAWTHLHPCRPNGRWRGQGRRSGKSAVIARPSATGTSGP